VLESERVANDLHHRRQAVGGARRVGDHVMILRVVLVGVDTHDERDVLALAGRGDDDLACAAIDVLVRVCCAGEATRSFEYYVDTELAPREEGGIALGEDLHVVTVHVKHSIAVRHIALEGAMDGVVLQEVRERPGVCEVVDRDEVDVGDFLFQRGAKHLPSDSSKAVDANTNCHVSILAKACRPLRGLARM